MNVLLTPCVCVCSQLPRAVNTQALSGAGFLKMINKASDAVNKMTIKMNESDTVRRENHGRLEPKTHVNLIHVFSANQKRNRSTHVYFGMCLSRHGRELCP